MGWMMVPWWFLGWALVIGVLAAVVVAIFWIIRRPGGSGQRVETPLEVLKPRLAKGEITAEQFETTRRQLSGD